jgi:ATP-dependent DNA helicase RecG
MELHSADLTKLLVRLVKSGLLEQKLAGRWTSYRLGPGTPLATASDTAGFKQLPLFNQGNWHTPQVEANTPQTGANTSHSGSITSHSGLIIPHSGSIIPHLSEAAVAQITQPAREGQPRQQVIDTIILQLCAGCYLTAQQLADLLERNAEGLRERYLTRLVASRQLQLRYPDKLRSKNQAYLAAPSAANHETPGLE